MELLLQHKKQLLRAFAQIAEAGLFVDQSSKPVYSPITDRCLFRLHTKDKHFREVSIHCSYQEMDELYRFAEELRLLQNAELETSTGEISEPCPKAPDCLTETDRAKLGD